MQFMLTRTSPIDAPPWCAICGREDQPTALWGVRPSVELAGSTITPPGSISICNDCERRHGLEPDREISDDQLNIFRGREGRAAHDFSAI
jgi:hypothetical protein